jgi:hypothetical protein
METEAIIRPVEDEEIEADIYESNDSDDSDDSDTVYPLESYDQDPDVDLFRELLSKWKEQSLEALTETSQNPQQLEVYTKECYKLYTILQEILKSDKTKTINYENNLDLPLLTFLREKQKKADFSTAFLTELSHVLTRDLIDCPFTYDTDAIDTMTDHIDTEFISNK